MQKKHFTKRSEECLFSSFYTTFPPFLGHFCGFVSSTWGWLTDAHQLHSLLSPNTAPGPTVRQETGNYCSMKHGSVNGHPIFLKIFMMFIKPFFSSTFVTIITGIWIMNSVTTILLATVGKCLLSQFVPHDLKLLRSHSVLFSFQATQCKQKLFTTLMGLIMTRGRFLSLTEKNPPLRFHSLSP